MVTPACALLWDDAYGMKGTRSAEPSTSYSANVRRNFAILLSKIYQRVGQGEVEEGREGGEGGGGALE